MRWTNQKEVLENHILIIGLKPSSNTTRESKENGLGLDGVGDLVSYVLFPLSFFWARAVADGFGDVVSVTLLSPSERAPYESIFNSPSSSSKLTPIYKSVPPPSLPYRTDELTKRNIDKQNRNTTSQVSHRSSTPSQNSTSQILRSIFLIFSERKILVRPPFSSPSLPFLLSLSFLPYFPSSLLFRNSNSSNSLNFCTKNGN